MMIAWNTRSLVFAALILTHSVSSYSQNPAPATPATPATTSEIPAPPPKVDIEPVARDEQIAARLLKILQATEWFENPEVNVRDGVVFLTGTALNDEYKTWATNLVRNTQDTVAVVNKIEVQQSSAWNFKPMFQSLREMWRSLLEQFPFIVLSFIILLLTLFIAGFSQQASNRLLAKRVQLPLLRELISRAVAAAIFVIGIYTVMRVSGTTQLALTILGGTGLFGLVLGIAFRDITENFLASIFLSMQRPFQIGDLVEIVGIIGHVERLTVRTTILVTTDGNYVQIPNATVYKSTIRNFTNNPKRRDELLIEIPNTRSIEQAQEVALKILNQHPAIIHQPAPWILANKTTPSTVELKILYWMDCVKHNILTTRSAILRLITEEFAARQLLPGLPEPSASEQRESKQRRQQRPLYFTRAEGSAGNASEAESLESQIREARPVEQGTNLLNGTT
jgi:small conductance mechanosensitive channel